jgi:hypothetical protein
MRLFESNRNVNIIKEIHTYIHICCNENKMFPLSFISHEFYSRTRRRVLQLDIKVEIMGSIPLSHAFSVVRNFTIINEKSI